MRPHNYIA